MPVIWVARLIISDSTEKKIISMHQIHPEDVRAAVVCVPGFASRSVGIGILSEDGARLLRPGLITNRPLLFYIRPTSGQDEWFLGSAYHTPD